ncbi:MAG: hypothetical protein ACOYN2_00695 [Patescibacteria group bacterium]
MKDLFTEFRKQNLKKHVAIGLCAFAFAVGVNAFLMTTDAGVKLQASAIEYAGGKKEAASPDLVLVSSGNGTDMVKLRMMHAATNVSEIQATVLFDPVALKSLTIDNDVDKNIELTKVSNIDGVALVIVRFKTPANITANTDLFQMAFSRKSAAKSPLNIASTTLVSEGTRYELSSKGMEF